MTISQIFKISDVELKKLTRDELGRMVSLLRDHLILERKSNEEKIGELKDTISKLKENEDSTKRRKINETVNQPTSKKPEWDKELPEKKKKKKRRAKGRPGRKGAGNRPKPDADEKNINPLEQCPNCATDLTDRPIITTYERIVEDIAPPPEKTIVSKETTESKWCPKCQQVVYSKTEAALPKSDIGINTLVLICYLWVVSAISLPGIANYLNAFFRITISTAGISRMMIRLRLILTPIHEEILSDLKAGAMIFADETGWRVHGKL